MVRLKINLHFSDTFSQIVYHSHNRIEELKNDKDIKHLD